MHSMHQGGIFLDIDIICGLYYYGLALIKIDDHYHLLDIKTREIYESMSIYYVRSLLRSWNSHRQANRNML